MTVTNVVVGRKRNIRVSSNGTSGILDTKVPVTLKNVPTVMSGGATTLDQLTDVNLAQRTDGATLIYDQPTNTYLVKEMVYTEISGSIDGGEF